MDLKWFVLLAACSGSKSRGAEDARRVVPETPRDAVPVSDAPTGGSGDVQIRVEWKDVPLVARASPGRNACGNAKPASVAPTTTWGIPEVFVVVDAPGKAPSFDARILLQDCLLSPRISIATTSLTIASGVEQPVKVTLHEIGKLPLGSDGIDAARTVYLPIAGHAVDASLEPRAIYRVDADEAAAWIVAADSPYFAVTEANGAVILRDVPVGTHNVTAWLPPRADQPARLAQGKATVVAGGLAEVTLDISR